jgi:hypothetical protein
LASIEAAAVAGLAYAGFAFASFTLLTRLPDASSATEIANFFADAGERRLAILALNLAAFSAIAFLWFVAVVRRRIGDREDRFFATVFFGSGILYAGLMLTSSALLAGPALGIEAVDGVAPGQEVYSTVAGAGFGLLLSVVPRVQAVFVVTTSTLVLRTGALARWVAILGYVVALVLFVIPILTEPAGLGFPAWVAVVSLTLLVRRAGAASPPPV